MREPTRARVARGLTQGVASVQEQAPSAPDQPAVKGTLLTKAGGHLSVLLSISGPGDSNTSQPLLVSCVFLVTQFPRQLISKKTRVQLRRASNHQAEASEAQLEHPPSPAHREFLEEN